MARIPINDETDPNLDAAIRSALLDVRASRGKLVNFQRALSNRPTVLRAMEGLLQAAYRDGSSLDRQHSELAYLTATTTNNCHF